jgi:mono/diheme cytochrome c family protein
VQIKFVQIMNVSLLTILIFVFTACNYSLDKSSGDPSGGIPVGQLGALSYGVVRARVFSPRCIACHGNSGGVNLDSYESTITNLVQIRRTTLELKTMPKGAPLSKDEAALLSAWIQMGAPKDAPNGSSAPAPLPGSGPLEPTFLSIKENIFSNRCVVCHNAAAPGAAKNVPLDNKSDLLNSPRDLVLPGNADESGLVIAIERNDDKRMPPASSGAASLSADEIKKIRQWIQSGAKD